MIDKSFYEQRGKKCIMRAPLVLFQPLGWFYPLKPLAPWFFYHSTFTTASRKHSLIPYSKSDSTIYTTTAVVSFPGSPLHASHLLSVFLVCLKLFTTICFRIGNVLLQCWHFSKCAFCLSAGNSGPPTA